MPLILNSYELHTVQFVDRIQVKKSSALSALCHRTKNLYNLANFYVQQEFFVVEAIRVG